MADNVWVNPSFSAQRANPLASPWEQSRTGEEIDNMTGEEQDARDRADRQWGAVLDGAVQGPGGVTPQERAPIPPEAVGPSPYGDTYN